MEAELSRLQGEREEKNRSKPVTVKKGPGAEEDGSRLAEVGNGNRE